MRNSGEGILRGDSGVCVRVCACERERGCTVMVPAPVFFIYCFFHSNLTLIFRVEMTDKIAAPQHLLALFLPLACSFSHTHITHCPQDLAAFRAN